MAEDPGRPPALPPAPCLLLPSIWPRIWLRPKAGVGGGSGWLVVSHLPLFPMFNFRRITLPEVVVPPAGGPETRVRQGVLGDVGDHSLEGYSPFSLRGTAQNPCGPALSQALTISQPPPFGHTNHSIPPGSQPTGLGCQFWTRLPKGTPPSPGAFHEWYFPGKPLRCDAVDGALACAPPLPAQRRATASSPLPPPLSFLPRSRCPLLGSHGGDSGLPPVTGRVAGFPSSLHFDPLNPPANVPQPRCCVTAASLGGAGCAWEVIL